MKTNLLSFSLLFFVFLVALPSVLAEDIVPAPWLGQYPGLTTCETINIWEFETAPNSTEVTFSDFCPTEDVAPRGFFEPGNCGWGEELGPVGGLEGVIFSVAPYEPLIFQTPDVPSNLEQWKLTQVQITTDDLISPETEIQVWSIIDPDYPVWQDAAIEASYDAGKSGMFDWGKVSSDGGSWYTFSYVFGCPGTPGGEVIIIDPSNQASISEVVIKTFTVLPEPNTMVVSGVLFGSLFFLGVFRRRWFYRSGNIS